jgi:hypothetical protein
LHAPRPKGYAFLPSHQLQPKISSSSNHALAALHLFAYLSNELPQFVKHADYVLKRQTLSFSQTLGQLNRE